LTVLKQEQPQYPQVAIDAHVSGRVTVMILIDQEGNVARACADNGHPLLRPAAVRAAMRWQFAYSCKSCAKYLQQTITFNFVR
jgi:TonB family protein